MVCFFGVCFCGCFCLVGWVWCFFFFVEPTKHLHIHLWEQKERKLFSTLLETGLAKRAMLASQLQSHTCKWDPLTIPLKIPDIVMQITLLDHSGHIVVLTLTWYWSFFWSTANTDHAGWSEYETLPIIYLESLSAFNGIKRLKFRLV